ncbi:tyrosine-type recombinase/integrase [Streptomyces sp. NPDC093249]|uniref:tyrosine-type recombinase/integrase n=1 Tax=unclassified Streptomyces TaxID=2593676 RepID=UPI00344C0512
MLDDMLSGGAPKITSSTSLTFGAWAADWLSRRRCKGATVTNYEIAVRVHLAPRWGKVRLLSISKSSIETWVQEMEASPSLANSTADGHWRVFKMIMKDAFQNGKISKNPTYEVSGPYVSKTVSHVFTLDECWAIHDALPDRYRPILMLGFACGTRQAEALGLCIDAIDFKHEVLTVRRQSLRTKETGHKQILVDRLKTSPSLPTKVAPIPPYLQEALREHIERFPPLPTTTVLWEHRKTIDTCERGPVRAVFTSSFDNLVDRNHFTQSVWRPTLTKLGIRDAAGKIPTFHDLRHTFISTCLQNAIPEHTVAQWVGDSVEQLRRTYSHLLKDHVETYGAVIAGLTMRPPMRVS